MGWGGVGRGGVGRGGVGLGAGTVGVILSILSIRELELELIQPHMAQKPVLRGEVGCACVAREISAERGCPLGMVAQTP